MAQRKGQVAVSRGRQISLRPGWPPSDTAVQIVVVLLACTFRLEEGGKVETEREREGKRRMEERSWEKTGHKSNLMAWARVRRKRSSRGTIRI